MAWLSENVHPLTTSVGVEILTMAPPTPRSTSYAALAPLPPLPPLPPMAWLPMNVLSSTVRVPPHVVMDGAADPPCR